MTTLAAHATILVYPVAPLDRTHAEALIKSKYEIQFFKYQLYAVCRANGFDSTDIQSYNSSNSKDTQTPIQAQDHNWRIENKYYKADVAFVIVGSEEVLAQKMKQEGEEPAVVVLAVRETVSHLLSLRMTRRIS